MKYYALSVWNFLKPLILPDESENSIRRKRSRKLSDTEEDSAWDSSYSEVRIDVLHIWSYHTLTDRFTFQSSFSKHMAETGQNTIALLQEISFF